MLCRDLVKKTTKLDLYLFLSNKVYFEGLKIKHQILHCFTSVCVCKVSLKSLRLSLFFFFIYIYVRLFSVTVMIKYLYIFVGFSLIQKIAINNHPKIYYNIYLLTQKIS